MTVSPTSRVRRTFTRDELRAALAAVDRVDILDGIYADRTDDPTRTGTRALTLDYDDEGDVGVLIVAVSRILDLDDAVDFAAATTDRLPGHPTDPGPRAMQWPCWLLDEPNPEQWWDEVNRCETCDALADVDGVTCASHARAPWDNRTAAQVW